MGARKGTTLEPMLFGENAEDREMAGLRDRLETTILENVEAAGVNGEGAPRVPNTSNIYFDYIEGEALIIALDLKGLAVSTGAACSAGAIEPSQCADGDGIASRPGPCQHSF